MGFRGLTRIARALQEQTVRELCGTRVAPRAPAVSEGDNLRAASDDPRRTAAGRACRVAPPRPRCRSAGRRARWCARDLHRVRLRDTACNEIRHGAVAGVVEHVAAVLAADGESGLLARARPRSLEVTDAAVELRRRACRYAARCNRIAARSPGEM